MEVEKTSGQLSCPMAFKDTVFFLCRWRAQRLGNLRFAERKFYLRRTLKGKRLLVLMKN